MYVPLFIIGFILSLKNVVQSIKGRKFDLTAVMVISFSTLLIGLLFTRIPTANKANVLYFLILYFVAIAIIKICENSYLAKIVMGTMIIVLFVNFYWSYITNSGIVGDGWYEDRYLYSLTEELESNDEYIDKPKYVLADKAAPYVYIMLESKISPQEYMATQKTEDVGDRIETTKVGNYKFIYTNDQIYEALTSQEEKIFIISTIYKNVINSMVEFGYEKQEYGYYAVLTQK